MCGTPRTMAFGSVIGPPTLSQPILLRRRPQNFAQPGDTVDLTFLAMLDIYVFQFFFAAEILADEVLSFHGIVAHIKLHYHGY